MTPEVSVVMPCLNEAATVGSCVRKALSTLEELGIAGEVIVADNGSTDGSKEIARSAGARVVPVGRKGYGAAYLGGIPEANGRYIIIGDSDDTYDFTDLERFITPLREGYDMVIGNRLKGEIEPGAMPWANRHIGNPFLSTFLNLIYKTQIGDAHCGMRSFTREAFERMKLKTPGMEFASEMVIKASLLGLKIREVPITLHHSPGERKPHLRPLPDGFRHLRFMLMYSPTHLFLVPGTVLLVLGFIPLLALLRGPIWIGGHGYDQHFMVLGSLLAILGYQIINLGLYAKAYSYQEKIISDPFIEGFYRKFNLHRGVILGTVIAAGGFAILVYLLVKFFALAGAIYELRLAILGLTFVIIGTQTIFSSFLLSIMEIKAGRE